MTVSASFRWGEALLFLDHITAMNHPAFAVKIQCISDVILLYRY